MFACQHGMLGCQNSVDVFDLHFKFQYFPSTQKWFDLELNFGKLHMHSAEGTSVAEYS